MHNCRRTEMHNCRCFGDRETGTAPPSGWKLLTEQSREGKIPRRFVTREQAARVGWRIIKNWLEAQLALIETQMVSLAQVMLPYMQVGQTGQSLYEAWRERQLALPPAGESS